MTRKCYIKPNRTKKRVFTANDVARIAKYAQEDGADVRDMIVRIAEALGVGFLLCILAKTTKAALTLTVLLAKIGGALALSTLIERILAILAGRAGIILKRVPGLNILIVLLIVAFEGVRKILDAIGTLAGEEQLMATASEFMDDLCARFNLLKQLEQL